jgi:Co/Zn/Cd efflux system component
MSALVDERGFRRTVAAVALANLAYFGIELGVAVSIGAVSLYADSIDFLEDACVNALVFVAVLWPARRRATAGMVLAALLLVPAAATVWAGVQKFLAPAVPAPLPLSLAGAGALVVNVGCALLLARFRSAAGSLSRAAFLSARNDAWANLAIIAAALVTRFAPSMWPDLLVGAAIFAMNVGAAREVYEEARRERAATLPVER